MFNPFICGSFHQEEGEGDEAWSPSSTPRRSRRSTGSTCTRKDSKNPYSTRGLDKFSALLADLEDKRQKIYAQMGSQDISFVRFVYSNSNDCVPIVVKARDKTKLGDIIEDKLGTNNSEALDKFPMESSAGAKVLKQPGLESDTKKKRFSSWINMKLDTLRRPYYYLPMIIILILLFLAVFGRSVAILCTSLGWYLVPTINGGSSNSKRPMKKKEYVRRLSENKMVMSDGLSSPKSNINTGTVKDKSPRHRHVHWKSL